MIAVIVGGGLSSRFSEDKLKFQEGLFDNLTKTCLLFINNERIKKVIVVVNQNNLQRYKEVFASFDKVSVVLGGSSRQASVENGILQESDAKYVIIHDGARPYLSDKTLNIVIDEVQKGNAVTAVAPLAESLRELKNGESRAVDREQYRLVHTPQAFPFSKLKKALLERKKDYSDEAALYEAFYDEQVVLVEDSARNVKLTYQGDGALQGVRVGVGRDCHRLVEGRKLILGGVHVPYDKGLLGVSDADVLLHAIMDAVLSAIGERDIGFQFPPSDKQYEGISSVVLLKRVLQMTYNKGYAILNIAATIELEQPKLSGYLPIIKQQIEVLTCCEVSLAATTTEGLGLIGEGKGAAVTATAAVVKKDIFSSNC